MKRDEMARQLADHTHISDAQARDQLDKLVHRILTTLRRGQPAEVPGVGRLKRVESVPLEIPLQRPVSAIPSSPGTRALKPVPVRGILANKLPDGAVAKRK